MSKHEPPGNSETMSRHGGSRKNSADMTRQLLRKREEEIDRRVADLKSRLGSNNDSTSPAPTPKVRRNVSQSSDDSCYQVNRGGLTYPKGYGGSSPGLGSRFGNQAFSDAERHSTTTGSDREHSSSKLRSSSAPRANAAGSQYPTNRRISSIKKPSFVPTPKPKKEKKSWMQWFCPCQPGRKNAADAAHAANSRYERQRLLEEEGRLQYSTSYGANGDASVNTPTNSYNHSSYAYGQSPRSSRARASPRLTPAGQRYNSGSTRY